MSSEQHRQNAERWLARLGSGISNGYTQAVAMAAMAELDMACYLRDEENRAAGVVGNQP